MITRTNFLHQQRNFDSGVGRRSRSAWLIATVLGALVSLGHSAAFAASATSHYTNPIGGSINMGDPFVLVDRARFLLYGTTAVNDGFNCWVSTNLVDWTERGFAYRKRADSWGGKTFWAPEVSWSITRTPTRRIPVADGWSTSIASPFRLTAASS
jgi:hypothetical protein